MGKLQEQKLNNFIKNCKDLGLEIAEENDKTTKIKIQS